MLFFFSGSGDHRDLHVLTHSFPTRRSADLLDARGLHGGHIGFGAAARRLDDAHATVDDRLNIFRIRRIGEAGQEGEVHAERLRSEEHTSELQSLMRISYAVFCLKKKKQQQTRMSTRNITNDYTASNI